MTNNQDSTATTMEEKIPTNTADRTPTTTEDRTSTTAEPFIVEAGASRFGESVKFMGRHPNDLKISAKDTGGQLAMFEYTGSERIGPVLHKHTAQDEIFYIVYGRYRFVVGDAIRELKEGDSIFLPRNVPHTWVQLTDTGKLIYMVQPAGNCEEFFNTMNALVGPPTEAEFQKISNDHGIINVGPPLIA